MLDPDVARFVVESLPAPPARVLEVGAGEGELAETLAGAGYDVLAIDPASSVAAVRPVPLHELREPAGGFDAAVAVVSLHHVEPLEASCRRLAELVRPGGAMVVDEFDVMRLDQRAARWWLARHEPHGDDMSPEDVVADLRHHCHALADVRRVLGRWFELTPPRRGPYLYRWARDLALRSEEEALIAAGELPATGARIVGIRRAQS